MKRLLPILFLSFFIILGVTFLIIVLRMVWFPPSSMGMMMGRHMMFQHMFYMFSQSLGISMVIVGLIILVLMFTNKGKK